MAFAVPRLRSAMVRPGRVSLVEHPMARLGDMSELAIMGTPTPVLRRENTLAGYPIRSEPTVNVSLDLQIGLAPDDSPRILQWPPEYLQKPGKPKVKFQDYAPHKHTTDFELIDVIREKLTTGFYGLKHMFRANDPTGQGNVSKEALLRILYNLCGYITREQFEKLLRRLSLDRRSTISFDSFINCFKDNETVQREWISPIQCLSLSEQPQTQNLEENLRSTDMMYCSPYSSPAYASAILREKLQNGKVFVHNLLPPACLEPNGYIVPPQLREAFAQIGVHLTDTDFYKLWGRYDRENIGVLHTSQFFRELDLDMKGHPKAFFTPRPNIHQKPFAQTCHHSKVVTSTERTNWTDKYTKDHHNGFNIERSRSTENTVKVETSVKESTELTRPEVIQAEAKMKSLKSKLKKQPRFDSAVDCLHYKFEEAYNALLAGFKLFDFLNDGYIARVDFRRVLKEFGFNIAAVDLEHFLARAGLRSIQGQVNYRDFLAKYQNKSEDSLTSQIVTNSNHAFHRDPDSTETLSAEDLEAKVVEYLHSDFIKLLSHFRTCDKYNLGVTTQHEFRSAIERRLGFSLSDRQWMQLKSDIGVDSDGLIRYTDFLENFHIEPGSWNRRREGGFVMAKFNNAFTPPPQVERLKERAKTLFIPPELPRSKYEGSKTVAEMEKLLEDLFKTRFHTFDKHFKEMDRKMTGRMSKWQFGALIKLTGLALSPQELDRLWTTVNVDPDGMLSYSALIKHFNSGQRVPAPPTEKKKSIVYEDTTGLIEAARKVQQEKREKERRAELERLAKKAENEKMEKDRQAQLEKLAKKAMMEKKEREKQEKKDREKLMKTSAWASHESAREMEEMANAKLVALHEHKISGLLGKIKQQVLSQTDYLKTYFQTRDRMGFSHISVTEMKNIMDRLYFNLLEDEKMELCNHFDLNSNGRFHYLKFMQAFNKSPTSCVQTNGNMSYNKNSHKLQSQLLKEWKNLRRAFKKMDPNNDGLMEVVDFKKVLHSCGISFTDEDLYHILAEFDANMDGKVSYDEFLHTLLDF